MAPKIEKGLLSLAKRAIAVMTASLSSLLSANSSPIIENANPSSIKEDEVEKFRLKILKPQLVLKQNPNNFSEPFLAMHTSHRSHSSHSSHISSYSSGHSSHSSHSSHYSHYSSVPSYSPSNSVPYTPPATSSSVKTINVQPVVSNKHSSATISSRTLKPGCEGKDVEILQSLLVKLKYNTYPTGTFNESTKRAVMQFQKDNYLLVDGKVDARTLEIIQKKADASSNAIATVPYEQLASTTIKGVLELGSEGKDVESLQNLLAIMQYDTYVTGYFSEETRRAVIQFQTDNQLVPDGRVKKRTFEIIKKKAEASSNKTTSVPNKQTDNTAINRVLELSREGNEYPVVSNKHSSTTTSNRTLQAGCEGKDVESLQVLLVKLKYDTYPTGSFSESTKRAVMQFQKDNYLIVDGRVDTRTFDIIQKKADASSNATAPVPFNQLAGITINRVLEFGSEGEDVKSLQHLLVIMQYEAYPTGYFSEETRRAVIQFQADNQLVPDGRVKKKTFEIIKKKAEASPNKTASVPNKQTDNTAISRVLEVGCEGKDVESLQALLLELKYDVYPTGSFFERTKRAVIQFQKDNQLMQDGRVEIKTFEIIKKKANELRLK